MNWRAILSLTVSFGLVVYVFHGVDWPSLLHTLRGARLELVLLCAVLVFSTYLVRSLRWGMLLATEAQLNFSSVFWANMAGYFANNLLPARAGELIRSYLICVWAGLSRSFVFTTVVGERVLDALVLAVIASAALLAAGIGNIQLRIAAHSVAVVSSIAAALLLIAPSAGTSWCRLLPGNPESRMRRWAAESASACRSIRRAVFTGRFWVATAVIWCLDAAAAILFAKSLGLEMPIPAAFLLNSALGLGSAVPSAPGYLGVFQFISVTILAPFGFSKSNALAYILLVQSISYLVVGIFGGVGFFKYRARIRKPTEQPSRPRRYEGRIPAQPSPDEAL